MQQVNIQFYFQTQMNEKIKKAIKFYQIDGYRYLANPFDTLESGIEPHLLYGSLKNILPISYISTDLVIGVEAMGITIAHSISEITGKPYRILRKKPIDEYYTVFHLIKEYCSERFFVPLVKRRSRVLLVDDIISTGKTMERSVEAFKNQDCEVIGIFALISRNEGARKVCNATSVPVTVLCEVWS